MGFFRDRSSYGSVWRRLTAAVRRLKENVWPILQASVAAGIAYLLAEFVLGNEQPFFAPIAAVVTLSLSLGERGRRAFEIALGVAIGLGIADLLVRIIGIGAVQIGVVVALAMAAAVLFGEGTLLVNQAAISAILVVLVQPPESGFSPDRFFNALVGGGVALAINHLFPMNPERLVEGAAKPIFEQLATALEDIAEALRKGDLELAEAVLDRTRQLDEEVRGFDEVLAAGHETARLSPTRRRSLKHLELYADASVRLELAVINTRVLARGAANAVRRKDSVPQPLARAVLDLSRAVRALASYLEEYEEPVDARRFALKAARDATQTLNERHDLATSVLVGQVRSMAVDLIRSTGMNQAQALEALEDAAGRASEVG